ncbi:MAG: 16S rRNA (guanine966-N2)-methyltransferase [Hyphomicrobiaceae bacterium]
MSAVPGRRTRPTSDRVREALFSRLESRYPMPGARVLDLFAGTGALGIEALSRGADLAVFVDVDRGVVDVMRANIRELDLAEHATILTRDFRAALLDLGKTERRFNGVFLDPPYRMELAPAALERLAASAVLMDGAWVALESGARDELGELDADYTVVHEKVYGDTKLTLLEWKAKAEQGDGQ